MKLKIKTNAFQVKPVVLVYAFDGVTLKFHNPPDSLDAVLGSRSHDVTEDEKAAGQIAPSLPTLLTTATTSHHSSGDSASPTVDDISTRDSSHASACVDQNSCEAEAAEMRISNFYGVQGSSAAFDVAQRTGSARAHLFPSAENMNTKFPPPPAALHGHPRGYVGPSSWLQRLTGVSPAEIEYFRPVCLAVQYENFMRYQVRLVVSITASLAYFLLPLALRGSQMPGQASGFPLVHYHRDSDEDWARYMLMSGAFVVADMLEGAAMLAMLGVGRYDARKFYFSESFWWPFSSQLRPARTCSRNSAVVVPVLPANSKTEARDHLCDVHGTAAQKPNILATDTDSSSRDHDVSNTGTRTAQSSSLEGRMRLLMQNVLRYFSLAEFFFVVFNVTLLWCFWLLWSPFKLKKLQDVLDLPNLDWGTIFLVCPEIGID